MTASIWRSPTSLRLLTLSPSIMGLVSGALAGSYDPVSDPYTSGPMRPPDGSPRSGVYSVSPTPSYDTARRNSSIVTTGPQDVVPIWNGLYIGAQTGYRWSNISVFGSGATAISADTPQGGAHFGYNFQTGHVVLGLQSDAMIGSAAASGSAIGATLTTRETWTSTVRGRAGYALGNMLLYGSAGAALAGQHLTIRAGSNTAHSADTRLGIVFGVGIEYKITPQLSTRFEGLHVSYRDSVMMWSSDTLVTRQDSNVIRAEMSFRFN